MTIKSILVAASGGSASNGAIEMACRLSQRFNAHLEGFHVRNDLTQITLATDGGMGIAPPQQVFDQIAEEAAATAAKAKTAFEGLVARHALQPITEKRGDPQSTAWRDETGSPENLIARRARFFDLVILGRSDRVIDEPHTDTIEETLRRSGRAVLLAPANPPNTFGEKITVGWNGSAEAIHALSASLPLLEKAKAVSIVTVGDSDEQTADDVVAYLSYHKVNATQRTVTPVSGNPPGTQLLAAAEADGADLLVLGGYSHAPWREALFGGTTSGLVKLSPLPLLLAH